MNDKRIPGESPINFAWRGWTNNGVIDADEMSIRDIFNAGFYRGEKAANEAMKAMAATADLSGVKTILADFAERMKDSIAALAKTGPRESLINARHLTLPDLEGMTDRQISNVMHGRDKDDNGEFTASSMGAANDALQREHSASPIPRDILADVAAVYQKREDEGRDAATGVVSPGYVWHKFRDGSACVIPINPHPTPDGYGSAADWSVASGKWSEERRKREDARTPESDYAKRKREADIMQMTADKGERANSAEPSAHRVNVENVRILVKRLGLKPAEIFPEYKFIPVHPYTPVGAQATFSDGSVWTRTE